MARKKVRVGVLFGGKSGEHEISLLSAKTVIHALDEAGYETVRLGITTTGEWITGGDPLAQLTDGNRQTQGQTHALVADGQRGSTALGPLLETPRATSRAV